MSHLDKLKILHPDKIYFSSVIWKLWLPTCGWYSGSSPWWLTTRSPSCPLRVMQACAGAKLLISKTNPITILLAGLGANPIWSWSPASSFILEAGCEYKWGLDLLYSQPTNQVLVGPPRIQDQVGRSRRTATRHRWLGGLLAWRLPPRSPVKVEDTHLTLGKLSLTYCIRHQLALPLNIFP